MTKTRSLATCLLTADLGRRDDDGDFWYSGHADDITSSAGYCAGLDVIEGALLRHRAVWQRVSARQSAC